MNIRRSFVGASLALVMATLSAGICRAQTLGYISSDLNFPFSLASFNPATGVIASPFSDGLGGGRTFAVSTDGTTLYVPSLADPASVLNVVSAATGQILQSVSLAYPAYKVLLSGNGARAYVLVQKGSNLGFAVEVVDLATATVKGAVEIPAGGIRSLVDIALSPNDSQLFLALSCGGSCRPLPAPCTVAKGICIFNALTLAFESQVSELSGLLSISQDGKSLYVAPNFEQFTLDVLNTQTLAQSSISLGGTLSGPPVVSPVGKYAVAFVNWTSGATGEAYILDTQTNAIVRKLFLTFPGGSKATSETSDSYLGNEAVFAPDGNSIWVNLWCTPGTGCSLPGGATQALTGFDFPSGDLIAETVLATVLNGEGNNISLAFPHVLTAKQ